jgi:hypothetical protein
MGSCVELQNTTKSEDSSERSGVGGETAVSGGLLGREG